MKNILVFIMAGGAGERLQPLTQERSKAAVPFGGKYRLIDFTLNNCINSELRQIFVLTQYKSESLISHIQDCWGISSKGLGDFVYCVPPKLDTRTGLYKGTADAVRQSLEPSRRKEITDVLVLSGDHIYKMDYRQLIAYHKANNAVLTISALPVNKKRAAKKLGVIEIDLNNRLISMEEKPAHPKSIPDNPDYALASMGIYIFKVETLLKALHDEGEDFAKHIIPAMITRYRDIYVYNYERENKIEDYYVEVQNGVRKKVLIDEISDSSYWKDVGTIDSYYEASMDLIGLSPQFNLYGQRWLFRTFARPLPACKCVLDGKILDSMVSDGCIISGGTVSSSILSPGVIVENDAIVEQSILFDNVTVEPGVRVKRAIIDKETTIREGVFIGYDLEADKNRGFTISDNGIVVVPKGMDIKRSRA